MKYLDRQLADWWQWYEKLLICELGYPSDYDIGRIRLFQPPKAVVPLVDIPQHLVLVDRAMREISPRLWFILAVRYWVSGPDAERCRKTGLSKSTYHRNISAAHKWINGYLWKTVDAWD